MSEDKSLFPEVQDPWDGMPEFIQESKASIKGVIVHFETTEDLEAFNELTGLNVTMKTKGIFFPPKIPIKAEYIDES